MKKKQPACRAKLRDKVTCPKCDKELSRHSYEYTHSKFCKGKPDKPTPVEETEDEEVKEITKKMEQITITELMEETKPKAKPKPKHQPKPQPKKYEEPPAQYTPTDDDIKRYLSNIRKEKAMRKQQGYEKLISTAF